MTMFEEIHFGQPPGDQHFDPLPRAQTLYWAKQIQNSNQHQKCFPTIYNMTMFGEINFGTTLGIILKMSET